MVQSEGKRMITKGKIVKVHILIFILLFIINMIIYTFTSLIF